MLSYILNRFGIQTADSVVVGDGENDVCMLKMAETGISFNSTSQWVEQVADYVFRERSLKPMLEVAR